MIKKYAVKNTHAKEVAERLRATYKETLLKEIWKADESQTDKKKRGPVPKNKDDKNLDASLYKWWWEFMNAAQEYNRMRNELNHRGGETKRKLELNEKYFGNLDDTFKSWWQKGGDKIFREKNIPYVEVKSPETCDEKTITETGVNVQIPLNISRKLIHDQIDILLDVYHPGDKLKVHKYSTADRKINYEQADRTRKFGLLLNIWREKEAVLAKKEKAYWWQIYCRAINDKKLEDRLSRKTKLNADERRGISDKTKKYYDQANELMQNALLGDFPKDPEYQETKGNRS